MTTLMTMAPLFLYASVILILIVLARLMTSTVYKSRASVIASEGLPTETGSWNKYDQTGNATRKSRSLRKNVTSPLIWAIALPFFPYILDWMMGVLR